MSNNTSDSAVVVNNAAVMTAYTVATETLKAADKAAKAADKAAIKAAGDVDKAKAESVKADKSGNKAASDKAADLVTIAGKAAEEAKAAAAKLHESYKAAAEDADKAYQAVLDHKAATDKAAADKAAEEAKAATDKAAADKAAEEAKAAAPMVLSNQEALALDVLKADSDKFAMLAENSAQLDAESLVVLARVKAQVQRAYVNWVKVKVWDTSAIVKMQQSFPYILTADSSEAALERFASERLNRSRSWVNSRIKIVGYPVLLANLSGRTIGIANEFASRFIVVTESMWRLAVSEDNTVKIGTTKIASSAVLWAEYCKAAKEHYDGLATEAGSATSTAFRKPGLDAQAEKFGKWESGLRDGSYEVENGIVRSKADKAAEEAKAAAAAAAAAADKAEKVKAAKAAADKAAKVKAAEEAKAAADKAADMAQLVALSLSQAAAAAAAAAANAPEEAKAESDKAAEEAKAAADKAAAAAEEAKAAAEVADKAAEVEKAAQIPVVLISDLIADHKSIESFQAERLTEYHDLSDDDLESVIVQLFEQLTHADRLDVCAYAAVAVYVAANRQ